MDSGIVKVRTAIVSVFDKAGAADFARALAENGVEILSTGGTAKLLKEKGVKVTDVSQYTGFPELFEGRVKTLHPLIHGGILFRRGNAADEAAAVKAGIKPIDLVAVNLYPLGGEIDVGGPAMIRAAAKNHESVAVVADPADYAAVIGEVKKLGGTTLETRKRLAKKAFALTAAYDAEIARGLSGAGDDYPENLVLSLKKVQGLRYGENPHQTAAFYSKTGLIPGVVQHGGKELSYNNFLDTDTALAIVMEFKEPFAVIVKHANPCGAATGKTLAEAFEKALATDKASAFGGIAAFNRKVDLAAAKAIGELFVEIVAAPGFEKDALEFLAQKKNRRLLDASGYLAGGLAAGLAGGLAGRHEQRLVRSALDGVLIQSPDETNEERAENFKTVTKKKPMKGEMDAALFAWKIAKHVKSNAVVFATPDRTIGIGAGQMSRVDSCRVAVEKAGNAGLDVKGTAMASDAFFPFRDAVDFAAQAGASVIIHPGGSKRDAEVVAAADEHGVAMVFTGVRHFRH
ncbi:MAG: bifunctional phosphoribosylaminoimidazolecarboxamide formyltransferase/IMP cyclohydrolase [Candidatus Micrarchaeota archaeon]|nr:bifunctional phosphoribosylaminoimidazolecarboxamide formyltransferase/IMP cyclohydrolase [Candidatus Micrarchaeota archaeon]